MHMQMLHLFKVGIQSAARDQLIYANSLEALRILFVTLEATPCFTFQMLCFRLHVVRLCSLSECEVGSMQMHLFIMSF